MWKSVVFATILFGLKSELLISNEVHKFFSGFGKGFLYRV